MRQDRDMFQAHPPLFTALLGAPNQLSPCKPITSLQLISWHWRGDSLVRFVVCADPRDYVSLGFVVRVRKHRIERIAGISSFVPFVAKLPAKRRALRVRVGG